MNEERRTTKTRSIIVIIIVLCLTAGCLIFAAGFFVVSTLYSIGQSDLDLNISSSHYWTHGCITPDQTKLGAVGDQATLVDLETGQISEKIEAYFEDVVCFSNGEIIGLSGQGLYSIREGVWLDSEVKAGNLTMLGRLEDDRIVDYYRSRDTTSTTRKYYGPLTLHVFGLRSEDEPANTIELPPEVFPDDLGEGNISWFETFPVRILDNDQLLVAAGYRPNFSFGNVQSRPWGLFTVDLNSGKVTQSGPIRTGDDVANMYLWDDMIATSDGQIVAAAFRLQPESKRQVVMVGLDADTDQEKFRVTFDKVHEAYRLRLNQRGDLLAVALKQATGPAVKTSVIEMNTGEILWQTEDNKGAIYLLEFLDDDSLVVMTSKRVVSHREGRSGELLWERWPNQ